MTQIYYDEDFAAELMQVTSKRIEEQIIHDIELLPTVPVLGSTDLPASIKQLYGDHVRKIPVGPFDVIYEILDSGDFLILGLVHQRTAR